MRARDERPLDDPALVREEYADETRLAARADAHRRGEGPDAVEVAFDAVADARPREVLEVGCGRGAFAERLARELGAAVVALDQSERMVELTRARGVDAVVGDARRLPFANASFDVAVANWMLYHVADLERALAELARVLRPGGSLVAATNGSDHMQELYDLLGAARRPGRFRAEDAPELLAPHFARVERRGAAGWTVFPDRAVAQAYVDASGSVLAGTLPPFAGPLRVRRTPVVLVAEKAG